METHPLGVSQVATPPRPAAVVTALAVAAALPPSAVRRALRLAHARAGHARRRRQAPPALPDRGRAQHRPRRPVRPAARPAPCRATERELELRANGVATPREQRAIRRAVAEPATGGGAVYTAPPPRSPKVKPGKPGARSPSEGFAVPPASAPRVVKQRDRRRATRSRSLPTSGAAATASGATTATTARARCRTPSTAAACSTARSCPATSRAGARRARDAGSRSTPTRDHVYMVVAGMRFDTSAHSRTGSRWTLEQRAPDGFAVTHPASL